MNDKQEYELPTGAIAMLATILPTGAWYKDEAKPARCIVDAVAADDALPPTPPALQPGKDEPQADFDARLDAWAEPSLCFAWTDRQKAAAKACVRHYLRNGNLAASRMTAALVAFFQLDEE